MAAPPCAAAAPLPAAGPQTEFASAVVSLPPLPALVVGTVAHHRAGPVTHAFRHRVYQWLVDLDDLPSHRWPLRSVAGFDARDHLGGTGPGAGRRIRANLEAYLAAHDVHLGPGSRVIMLANARVLGHVFDPLSVFWCLGADGAVRCVVAEVHNTYGERHAYLLQPDPSGSADTDKQFYVSPFNDLSGRYTLRFELSPQRVRVSVTLHRDGATVFGAVLDGEPIAATRTAVARTALRVPLMPQRVSGLIRLHGIRLWIRRLPLVPRPPHHPPKGV